MQKPTKYCLNCEKEITNTRIERKSQKYCNTLCSAFYKVKVDRKTRHLTGIKRKRARWMLFNKDKVKTSQAKHYRLNKRKRILNVRQWEKKNQEKVKKRKAEWAKSNNGKILHRNSALKSYHKKQGIIKFLNMMNDTNSFINVTL